MKWAHQVECLNKVKGSTDFLDGKKYKDGNVKIK